MRWPQEFCPKFAEPNADEPEAIPFAFLGEEMLLTDEGKLPTAAALDALPPPQAHFVMGALSSRPCRASHWKAGTALPSHLRPVALRDLHSLLPEGYWAIAARAKQMLAWDLASRYCGTCGSPTQPAANEPAKVCPTCSSRDFPRISPAVIVIIRKGNQILLARSPHFRAGMYGALAGFMEAGESVEECLHREVFEEVGIRIKNIRWFDSQTWPFPNSLMLGFHADYESGEITPQPGEIEHADWFTAENLPDLPYPVSIAYRLITATLEDIAKESQRAPIASLA